MKPRFLFTTWTVNDLTEVKLCYIEGRLVALVPKRWEPHMVDQRQQSTGAIEGFDEVGDPLMGKKEDGSPRNFKVYRVLEWQQIDLADYVKGLLA